MSQEFSATPSSAANSGGELPPTALGKLLLRAVDAGLVGIPLAGPWFMGGRHPLGELVLVTLCVAVALSWLVERALARRTAALTRTRAEWILLASVALVLVQLAPLPQPLNDLLAPHTRELLPLWRGDAAVPGTLGDWNQVTMTPAWTRAGLVLLLAYGLLFWVAVQRLRRIADVEWLLRWIAAAVALQAAFGIAQYLTSNGKFVWIYQHPFRDTHNWVMGAYINKNHFAHLMALGLGPLVWLVGCGLRRPERSEKTDFGSAPDSASRQLRTLAALAALGITLFAGMMTLSRGGAAAMFLATLVTVVALYRAQMFGKRFVGVLAGIFVLIGTSLAIHGYRQVSERFDDYTSGSIEDLDRVGARRAIWTADLAALRDYSPLGAGVGSHREINPMYLTQPWEVEFTHAENGYLQVALETGLPGLALLLAGIATCCAWCRRSMRLANDRRIYLCAAAVSAGLFASMLHSLVDFVWYIPSLMSITVLLMACAFRLARWSIAAQPAPARQIAWSPWQYAVLASAVALVGPWMIYDRFCAAEAEPHWDRFLSYVLDPGLEQKPADKNIVEHLESVLYWTPDHAKAHIRLASLLVARFEQLQRQSPNMMPLHQVCEAAFASREHFHSRRELDDWLDRAVGAHRKLLDVALWHLHRGLSLSPLMGEGYVHLADLCFLEGAGPAAKTANLDQALKVRPYDGVVLLAAGSAAALRQDVDGMLDYWRPVLRCREQERRAMVKLLISSQLPLDVVLEQFQPDLAATRLMNELYAQAMPIDQMQPLLVHYGQLLQDTIRGADAETAAPQWVELHGVFRALNRPTEMIECLRHALAGRPSDFEMHRMLGQRLCEQGEFAAAEEQLNWCISRRPQERGLQEDLAKAVKGRIDGQTGRAAANRQVR
jgi:O-antigen ligase